MKYPRQNSVSATGMFLHAEIHPLLGIANVFILNANNGNDNFINNINVTVKQNDLCIIDNKSELSTRFKLKNVQFLPHTCSNLQQLGNEGLRFRIQIKLLTTPTESNNISNYLKPEAQYKANCVFCGSDLIHKNTSFDRVLPLPSNSACGEYTNWFCCQHSTPQFPILHPKEKDIFYSHQYMIVNSRVIDLCAVKCDGKNSVSCKRCDSTIGETKLGNPDDLPAFKLHKNAVIFNSSDESNNKSVNFCENIFKSVLLNFHKDSTNKFLITNDAKKKFAIAIWLPNVEMLNFSTFFMPKNQDEMVSNSNNTLKVLYLIVDTSSEMCNEWKIDPAVELVSFTEEFQLKIASILVNRTKNLPNVLKKIDTYWVSYL